MKRYRKKIDKNSMEYLCKNLFHHEDIVGFQFTAGNTPLGIIENRPLTMSCSLNKTRSFVVIDCSETTLERLIEKEIFGEEDYVIDMNKLRDLQKQFSNLGYEVEEGEFAGQWYWFRIKCNNYEIPLHIENLKKNLKL